MSVLNILESSRRNFFNGVNTTDMRISMIGWKKILASKKKGGLGVSSFLLLPCAPVQMDMAIHFSWFFFMVSFYKGHLCKGIYLKSLVKRKEGNGDNTYFWDDSCSPFKAPLSEVVSTIDGFGVLIPQDIFRLSQPVLV
nr:hypothetical protein [Tanacetum cinerariifolium]